MKVMLAALGALVVLLLIGLASSSTAGPGRRFPALRTGAAILRAAAIIGALVNVLFAGFAAWIALNGDFSSILAAVLWSLGAILLSVAGFMIPEFIELLIALEENTRQRRPPEHASDGPTTWS